MSSNRLTINKNNIIVRYAEFIVGLFIASLGVAFSTKAGLGTSPVASVPYSVSLIFPILTFGGWLNAWSILQICIQVAILRSRCNPVEIVIQTILALVYGYMTDFSCYLIAGINVSSYPGRLSLLIVSCLVLGLGIFIQFKGGVAMLPGEAMNRAISIVTGKKYENIKVFFDVLYIVMAVVICLVAFGNLPGVREGSIIAAIAVGNIIKGYGWIFNKLFIKK